MWTMFLIITACLLQTNRLVTFVFSHVDYVSNHYCVFVTDEGGPQANRGVLEFPGVQSQEELSGGTEADAAPWGR